MGERRNGVMEKKYEDIKFNSVSVCSIRDQEEG